MNVGMIGISHNEAPIEIRELASLQDIKTIELTDIILDLGIEEVVILSTCNRTEIYFATSKDLEKGIEMIRVAFMNYIHKHLESYLFTLQHEEAIKHLYYVACGLDSIVLGEDQILGQVKDAIAFSIEIGGSKKILNKIFREAVTFSKKMRTVHKISENALSIPSLSIKYISEIIGGYANKNVLIIGTGEMGQLLLKYLELEEPKKIYLTTRSNRQQREEVQDVQRILYENRYNILPQVDVVFTATSSPHIIIKKDKLPRLRNKVTMMDIAVPRDIEQDLKNHPMVGLYDVDDLKKITDRNLEQRQQIAKEIELEIEKAIMDLSEWIKSSKIDPIIQSLHQLCDEVLEDSLHVIFNKVNVTDREKKFIEKILNSSFKRILRTPIKQLKDLDEEGQIQSYKAVISKLFEFDEV